MAKSRFFLTYSTISVYVFNLYDKIRIKCVFFQKKGGMSKRKNCNFATLNTKHTY